VRPFLRLVWKEARELLRPQYILPILLIPVLFVGMGQGIGAVADSGAGDPIVGVVDHDDGEYGTVVAETLRSEANVSYEGTDREAAIRETRAADGESVVVIPTNFSERIENGERGTVHVYTVTDSVSLFGAVSSADVERVLQRAATNVTVAKTGATRAELDPIGHSYTTIVRGERIETSPAELSATLAGQFFFVPAVITVTILFSGQMVMNSMASETENRTLETLLTMPVPRRTIVAAKLVGGSAIGLFATAVYMVGLSFLQIGSDFAGGATSALTLGGLEYVLIGLSLFLALVGTLALALSLGIFADSQQGAQMLLLPLVGLTMVPFFMTMFTDFTSLSLPMQAVLFLIPFTHPVIAPKQLLFGGTELVVAGLAYELVFAAGMIYLTVRLFDSDRPITGRAGWFDRLFDLVQR